MLIIWPVQQEQRRMDSIKHRLYIVLNAQLHWLALGSTAVLMQLPIAAAADTTASTAAVAAANQLLTLRSSLSD